MSTVRLAVLGAGFMGSTHARAYATNDQAEIAAIYAASNRRAGPLAEELGTKWVGDLDTVLNDSSIDAVDICLPTPEHLEVTRRALNAGKHVLLEKPLALTEADGEELVRLAENSDRVVMVGHVLRFWPEYVKIKELSDSGELGRPLMAQAIRRQPFPAWSTLFSQSEKTGGAILDQMIHDYDALNWILGTPHRVSASGVRNPRTNGLDQTHVLIQYDDASGVADGGMTMPETYPFTAKLDVLFEQGAAEFAFRAGGRSFEEGEATHELWVYRNEGSPELVEADQTDAYELEVAYFVDCVRRGVPADRAKPADALTALRVALAAKRAAESGEQQVL